MKLLQSDRATIEEALCRIDAGERGREWFIFEGSSYPDAFVDTADYILVVEGKRTERNPTSTTRWLAGREQMWRHIDAAWEIRDRRPVLGLMIVEGSNDGRIPDKWANVARELSNPEVVAKSLPHREEEAKLMARSFVGVTTWQRICREFGVDPTSLPDTVGDAEYWTPRRIEGRNQQRLTTG